MLLLRGNVSAVVTNHNTFLPLKVLYNPRPSSYTRGMAPQASAPIVQYSPLLPPVGSGPCLSSVWLVPLSADQLGIVALVSRYHQQANPHLGTSDGLRGPKVPSLVPATLCGISHRFQWLSPPSGSFPDITHPSATRVKQQAASCYRSTCVFGLRSVQS